ncbi:MAG: hypothetical protein ABL888_09765 [Pirellulaceae bacterium]
MTGFAGRIQIELNCLFAKNLSAKRSKNPAVPENPVDPVGHFLPLYIALD